MNKKIYHSSAILKLSTMLLLLISASMASSADISIVSKHSDGTQGAGDSNNPAISADGQFVTFTSTTSNLVTGDTNGNQDIFIHDKNTSTTTRVSVATGGAEGNDSSYTPAISADGHFVTFTSTASNLVTGDTNGNQDIFIHDRNTSTTSRVSVATGGAEGNDSSYTPAISADGRFVTFTSTASDLVAGDTNSRGDIFVHDRNTGTTTRVSVDNNGVKGNTDSNSPAISANGRFVTFYSTATNLVAGVTNTAYDDIFVHDRNTSTTSRVSVATGGAEGNDSSYTPAISADGRFVSFASLATNLVAGDTNATYDIFVHDRNTNTTTRANVATGGAEGNFFSAFVAISADGRFITFRSHATNLVLGDTNGVADIFITENPFLAPLYVPVAEVQNDFDGDGYSDIFWRNAATNTNKIYLMNGQTINSETDLSYLGDPAWAVVAHIDFNNDDDKTDLLWRNQTTGANQIALMDGANAPTTVVLSLPALVDPAWKIAGVGDFDGDNKNDIFWHNDNGENRITFMDGTTAWITSVVNTINDTNWKVAGIADFNNDN